jgi:molecular chaperone DnaK
MSYLLGVDLGTTYTAAGIVRPGRTDIVSLGNRAATIPSVVFLREDETVLTGEPAERRGATEPGRLAREFKRRIGDPTPLIVGGTPYSAEAVTAKLLRAVVDQVADLEGGPPETVAVTHPANWGVYKQDLLGQAVRMADLPTGVTLTEPEAAAIYYASQERVDPGSIVAVYDLGGGTFDAAVLRKSGDGFTILGAPEGIERLGGVDFDEAVFAHVRGALDGALEQLDPNDPTAMAAVARLRQECVGAKEALSSDTDASIPVLLPNLQTEVRLTRSEFESMIRPALGDSIGALHRALTSAGTAPADVDAVLLVGGSSRIPLVAQLVGRELGRPVAIDAHPKHSVAIGAAIHAEHVASQRGLVTVATEAARRDAPGAAAGGAAGGVAGAAAGALVAGDGPGDGPAPGAHDAPDAPGLPASPDTAPSEAVTGSGSAHDDAAGRRGGGDAGTGRGGDGTTAAAPPARLGGRSRLLAVAASLAVLVAAGTGAAIFLGGSDEDPGTVVADEAAGEPTDDAPDAYPGGDEVAEEETAPEEPAYETEYVRIDDVALSDGYYEVSYTTFNFEPLIADGRLHIHFFLDTTEPANAGTNGDPPGDWHLTDEPERFVTKYAPGNRGDAERICAVVATGAHAVHAADSGNCVDLP